MTNILSFHHLKYTFLFKKKIIILYLNTFEFIYCKKSFYFFPNIECITDSFGFMEGIIHKNEKNIATLNSTIQRFQKIQCKLGIFFSVSSELGSVTIVFM